MIDALETQVANRKQVLLSEIKEHKMNSSRAGAADAVDRIKERLTELAHIVKGGNAALRLEAWVAR